MGQQQGAEEEGQTDGRQGGAHRLPPAAAPVEQARGQTKEDRQRGHDEGPGGGVGEPGGLEQGPQQQSAAGGRAQQRQGTGHGITS